MSTRAKTLLQALGLPGLKCHVPGCRAVIWAATGLQELDKLQAHMRRTHLVDWSVEQTLFNRAEIEKRKQIKYLKIKRRLP